MAEREFTTAEIVERIKREWGEFLRHAPYNPSHDGRGMLCTEGDSWGLIVSDHYGLCLWSLRPRPDGDGLCAVRVPIVENRIWRALSEVYVEGRAVG